MSDRTHHRHTMRALLVVAALAASGCAPHTGGGPSGVVLDPPPGRGELILRMDTSGGFVAPQMTMQQMPAFSLYGDGLTITQGAQIEIYPGPALPSLIATSLTTDGVNALLRDAIAAGLGADHAYTTMTVSDMPTTTFTLVRNGVTYTTSVYALGVSGAATPGVSSSERTARARLAKFAAELSNLRASLPQGSVGPDTQYTPEGLRIFVQPAQPSPAQPASGELAPGQTSGAPGQPSGPAALHEKTVTWPLSTPLARFGEPVSGMPDTRCGAVSGSDLKRLLPLVRSANQLTPWRSNGATFSLTFRVLLPDEEGC